MKIQLYVYTGTGNSLWVARQMAQELKGAALGFMPTLSRELTVEAGRVGLIFPVHIWGLPVRVIRFINHLRVNSGTYFFALAVNAGQHAAQYPRYHHPEVTLKDMLEQAEANKL
ncbi:MAG: hypothetical protein A2V86_17120 [Deltaproteobacteria bacterium RBG_16_49_23]|nr:MAG: hypothetical protein A2V86_17120 [Deltaproteobacteria bacterium RBG_16_49_23]